MSFILDALKKSEIERQRQTEPGLMDAGSVQRRGRLLVTINIAVLLIMLIRNGAPTVRSTPAARADASHAKAAPAAQTAAENPATFSPLDSSPVYAPEIPLAAA